MVYIRLNCTEITNDFLRCIKEYEYLYDFENIMLVITLITSIFGMAFNSVSTYIFFTSKNLNFRFLQLVKYFNLNSLLTNVNIFILTIVYLTTYQTHYRSNFGNFFDDIHWGYYFTHAYLFFYVTFFSVSGVLDIFIVFDRIQIMNPNIKFLKSLSARIIFFSVLIYCCILNMSVNLSRKVSVTTIEFENKTVQVYEYKLRKFSSQGIIMLLIYFSNFIRDLVPFFLEIITNAYLVSLTYTFIKKKSSLNSNPKQIAFNLTQINNAKMAFVISLLSSTIHVMNFSLLIILITLPSEAYWIGGNVSLGIMNTRHAFSIFIYLKLNKKFRQNFFRLMPKWFEGYFQ